MAVRVPARDAEAAASRLHDHFPAGLEEVSLGDVVELAVYVDEREVDDVRGLFPDATSRPAPIGWEDRWKEFHRPVLAGGLWIGPPWIEPPAGARTVVVDPGRAFGTGAHPTTRACIELLAGLERASVLDAGCGSGVLAVAAARLGFAPILAVDVDEVAVQVARETAAANDVTVDVVTADVLLDDLPESDVLVANIELRIVERLLPRARAGVAITSGYDLSNTPVAAGWEHADRLELEGWAADVLVLA